MFFRLLLKIRLSYSDLHYFLYYSNSITGLLKLLVRTSPSQPLTGLGPLRKSSNQSELIVHELVQTNSPESGGGPSGALADIDDEGA